MLKFDSKTFTFVLYGIVSYWFVESFWKLKKLTTIRPIWLRKKWNFHTVRERLKVLALTLKRTRNSLGGAGLGFWRLSKAIFATKKSNWSLKCLAGSDRKG